MTARAGRLKYNIIETPTHEKDRISETGQYTTIDLDNNQFIVER